MPSNKSDGTLYPLLSKKSHLADNLSVTLIRETAEMGTYQLHRSLKPKNLQDHKSSVGDPCSIPKRDRPQSQTENPDSGTAEVEDQNLWRCSYSTLA